MDYSGDRGMIARATADERRNSKRPSVTKTFGRLCVYSMTSVKSLHKADNRIQLICLSCLRSRNILFKREHIRDKSSISGKKMCKIIENRASAPQKTTQSFDGTNGTKRVWPSFLVVLTW